MAARAGGAWGTGPPISAQTSVQRTVTLSASEPAQETDRVRTPLSIALAYARQHVLHDRNLTKPSLNIAQAAACKALRTVIREFMTKYPDAPRPEVELQPNDSMMPRHCFYAITVLWRKQDTDGLLHFLANEKESNLHRVDPSLRGSTCSTLPRSRLAR